MYIDKIPWLELGGVSKPGWLVWPGHPFPDELVKMQVISICVVLVPQHLHKDRYDSSSTEDRREERSPAYDSWGNMGHSLTISHRLLTGM